MEDIEHYDIPVYNFPYDVEEDDEETIQDNKELRVNKMFCRFQSLLTCHNRRSFLSPLLVLRRRSRLMGSLLGLASIRGALLKSTTPSTLISAGSEVPFSSMDNSFASEIFC